MITTSPPTLNLSYPVVTMGTFDGVHIGHRKLLQTVVDKARSQNGESIVITYYHHPKEVLNKALLPYLLTEKERKTDILKEIGIDYVAYLNFNTEMSLMSAEDFTSQIIMGKFNAKEIILGYDCHFAHNRQGNFEFLQARQEQYGYKTLLIPPVYLDDTIVSSSHIRELIKMSKVEEAAKFLGRNYDLSGMVVIGEGIGKELNAPTINIQASDPNKLLPGNGVYISRVKLDGEKHFAVTNIGLAPTLKHLTSPVIESHILDFEGDLYGSSVTLEFITKLRDEKVFPSRLLLAEAIQNDIKQARKYLTAKGDNI